MVNVTVRKAVSQGRLLVLVQRKGITAALRDLCAISQTAGYDDNGFCALSSFNQQVYHDEQG